MDAACLVRAKEPPLPWQDQAPWRGVPVRSSESGLRLLQMLEATDESPRKASLLVIGAPDRDVAELLESLENKEGWRDGLRGASRVDQHFYWHSATRGASPRRRGSWKTTSVGSSWSTTASTTWTRTTMRYGAADVRVLLRPARSRRRRRPRAAQAQR